MADTRTFEERLEEIYYPELAGRLVGIEQIEYYEKAVVRMHSLERALNKVVDILGCGGKDRFIAAFDPDQDLDREALDFLKGYLGVTAEGGKTSET